NVEDMDGMFANCSNLTSVDLSGLATGKVENMDGMFYGCRSLSVIDLSGWDTTLTDSAEMFKVESRTPLLVITDNDFFENYDYDSDNRTLFTTKLKVDGKNVAFRVNKDEENVSYNADNTIKYINIYTTYTTTDTKEKILQRLAKRLEKEKNNLIVANGYSNLEWQPVDDYDDKVGYSLAGTYVISFDGGETENNNSNNNTSGHDWSTIENSGGSSGGGSSSSSTNQDLISKNESTDIKTPAPIKSEIPEKLRTRKYLIGYDDEKIKPENYVTNAEFATVIYRLMNDGEEINYDKLKDFGVEKWDWFAEAVAYLIDDSRQIIKVTDEKFNPNKNITGYEMLNIIHNVLKFYGADKSLMNNQDLNSHVTRAKMSEIIFNAFERKNNPGQKIYSDLNDQHWAYKYLMDASE
ncbi:MAG: BspA family leucine-rich repeat surface protein, partial [Firmicutes bacterium]|nr:BspA family leucine-rich repeat surface protein [Bacillota bacterium]